MKRLFILFALVFPLALTSASLYADVKTREKTSIKFEGMLGRMMGLFGGGRAARDGITSTTAVQGDRKAVMNDSNGQIIDLSEEKVYELDVKKKTYTVQTFEEIRNEMREAQEKAEREAEKQAEREPEEPREPGKEYEVDFDVNETGEKKPVAGYDTRQVIMTITLREKGKTLEEGGGFVMTADSWMGPKIPAIQEIGEFEMRYWKQLQGPEVGAMSAQQMAALLAAFPMVQKAMERMKQEGSKLEGTPLASTTTFESVKSKAMMEQQKQEGGGGGLGGMLARRMKKEDPKPRATIFTTTSEYLEVGTNVAPGDLAIPDGFKEKK
jgi:hypothetical protein